MSPAEIFARLEAQYPDLPKGYLDATWAAESSRGKHLRNPSGARGPFQFMPQTAREFGLDSSSIDDLTASATATAKMATRDAKTMAKLGIPVTIGSLYTYHQQGPGGGKALLTSDPSEPAVKALARAYGGNEAIARRAIKQNGGDPDKMTAGDFANHIASHIYSKAGIEPETTRVQRPAQRKTGPSKPDAGIAFLQALPSLATNGTPMFLQGLNLDAPKRKPQPSGPRYPDMPEPDTPASDFLRKILRDVGVDW